VAIEADVVLERVLGVTWPGVLALAEDLALAVDPVSAEDPASAADLVSVVGPALVLHHSVARRRRCLVE